MVCWALILITRSNRTALEIDDIAAIARRHSLVIATGNDRDYRRPGLKVFNPFKELA